jgi:hypothetical protein
VEHKRGIWEMHKEFLSENLKRKNQLRDFSLDGMIILKWI